MFAARGFPPAYSFRQQLQTLTHLLSDPAWKEAKLSTSKTHMFISQHIHILPAHKTQFTGILFHIIYKLEVFDAPKGMISHFSLSFRASDSIMPETFVLREPLCSETRQSWFKHARWISVYRWMIKEAGLLKKDRRCGNVWILLSSSQGPPLEQIPASQKKKKIERARITASWEKASWLIIMYVVHLQSVPYDIFK